ncbi:NOT2/NOT3/NOT5 [Hexamita inflata]|uniref:C-terminal n=1 Tax=Hexamita inflata TaxID=28002 RepID=A0AA86PYG4_9EUKA|nr:C-terminal [Hexamita inflata]
MMMNHYSCAWFDAIKQQNDQDLVQIVHGYDSSLIGINSNATLESFKTLWYPQTLQPQFCLPNAFSQINTNKYPISELSDNLENVVDQTLFFVMNYSNDELTRAAGERELIRRGWQLNALNIWQNTDKKIQCLDGEIVNL